MEAATKNFRKRNAIYECLCQSKAHPSADMVHAMLQSTHPDISLATIYRNLALFKKQGMIMSLGTVNGVERFDANTTPHAHFVCNDCTAVIDLHQMQIPEALPQTAEACCGGRVDECQVAFTGICRECLKRGEAI